MQKISNFLLRVTGWKVTVKVDEPQKSIICVAPHTSNWDFLLGKLAYWSLNRDASFLMKKSWFFFPLGNMFRAMGGIAIDRSKKNSVTQSMINEFEKREKFHLAITAEGTRSLVENWKLGFYHIANGAQVPIQIAMLDYGKKEVYIEALFYPTGNVEEDLEKIYAYYHDVTARFPEKFNLSAVNRLKAKQK